jgi:hypothetical protein
MIVMACGIPFTVVEMEDGDFDVFGRTEAKPALIRVNKTCSPEQREATTVHEWCHAVLMCNGVVHDEAVVAVLATELYREGFRVKVQE